MKLKAKVRQLRRNPAIVDRQTIETDRNDLTAQFLQLKQCQQAAGVAEPNSSIIQYSESVDAWDDLVFDPVPISADVAISNTEYAQARAEAIESNTPLSTQSNQSPSMKSFGSVPIEDQLIALPSNGNTSNVYRDLELKHRVSKAEELLSHIRNLIAEKSFQFSHVIRVSPRRSATTRSRAAVKKLNNQIAENCRMYSRCRSCLLILGAEASILTRIKVLNPEDVAGSTAVLNPNQPGSTSIKLSWIWQISQRHLIGLPRENADGHAEADISADDHTGLLECECISYKCGNPFNAPQFGAFIGCELELSE